jgi:uroporphyrinogen-III synthase
MKSVRRSTGSAKAAKTTPASTPVAPPLGDLRVLVTRPAHQASPLSRRLARLGARPIELPAISITPAPDTGQLDRALAKLGDYDWVVVTSANAVPMIVRRMRKLGSLSSGPRWAAIGPATARRLRAYGIRPDYIPTRFVAEAVVDGLGDVHDKRILLPRAAGAREILAQGLRDRGAQVDEIALYEARPEHSSARLRQVLEAGIDIITLTSSSGAKALAQMAEGYREMLVSTPVACIGPITAGTARHLGLRVEAVAEEYNVRGLVTAIVIWNSRRQARS